MIIGHCTLIRFCLNTYLHCPRLCKDILHFLCRPALGIGISLAPVPPTDALRRLPTDLHAFGRLMELAVRTSFSLSATFHVELLCRTAHGCYCTQFSDALAARVQSLTQVTLDSTCWTSTPPPHPHPPNFSPPPFSKNRARRDCFVMTGIHPSHDWLYI